LGICRTLLIETSTRPGGPSPSCRSKEHAGERVHPRQHQRDRPGGVCSLLRGLLRDGGGAFARLLRAGALAAGRGPAIAPFLDEDPAPARHHFALVEVNWPDVTTLDREVIPEIQKIGGDKDAVLYLTPLER